jgi:lipopolysaccharide transport system ATP-binding protein
MPYAVTAQGLSKQYRRYDSHRPRTIMEAALGGFRRMQSTKQFWALQDVGLAVMPGQMLGVIGHNGAGKSTLLQVLSGVVHPDAGQVQVRGRMGALLDLGAGFHPDLTGRENVFVSAIMAGLTRQEAERQFEAMVEFAELAAFIDNPVRTYSTGMQMRLAFSVAIHTHADVLFVDEFLSVGDLSFQSKCLNRIAELKARGCAVIFISHNVEQIQQLCDQVLWLEQGQVKAYGEPATIASDFATRMGLKPQQFRASSQQIKISSIRLLNLQGLPLAAISSGDPLTIELTYQAQQAFENLIFNFSISDSEGQIYFNTSSAAPGLSIAVQPGVSRIKLHLERIDLKGGQYYVNAGMFAPDWSFTYDYCWNRYPFLINWTPNEQTLLYPPRRWEILGVNQPDSTLA